jgi:hypothetical protein
MESIADEGVAHLQGAVCLFRAVWRGFAICSGAVEFAWSSYGVCVHIACVGGAGSVCARADAGRAASLCADVPLQLEAFEEGKKQITKELPERWRFEDVLSTRHLGDAWTASQASVVLVIPSVVIDGEWNVLLNPEHRDAAKLKVLDVRPFRFDARMFNVR